MSNNKNRNKNNINKTIMIKKVSNNKNKKKEIEKKNEESTKYKKKVENSRIKKNESLYDNENLNFTKQQKFNFESYQFEDEMDTIFLDKRKKKRVESKNLKKELIKVKKQKKRYKINFFITLFMFVITSILLVVLLYIHINYDPKVETKIVKEKIVDDNYLFLGDSLTHRYDLEKYYSNFPVVNSGVEGDSASNILNDIKKRVYDYNPSKVILLIGTNDLDLSYNLSPQDVFNNIKKIVEEIKENRKCSKIYIESLYPINKELDSEALRNKGNERILELNKLIKRFCKESDCTYIDIHSKLVDENGNLQESLTKDGLHLLDKGYDIITDEIKRVVFAKG